VIAPDSSVVIAALIPRHVAHQPAREALIAADRRPKTYEGLGVDARFVAADDGP
jgi:hypothetical protein